MDPILIEVKKQSNNIDHRKNINQKLIEVKIKSNNMDMIKHSDPILIEV